MPPMQMREAFLWACDVLLGVDCRLDRSHGARGLDRHAGPEREISVLQPAEERSEKEITKNKNPLARIQVFYRF